MQRSLRARIQPQTYGGSPADEAPVFDFVFAVASLVGLLTKPVGHGGIGPVARSALEPLPQINLVTHPGAPKRAPSIRMGGRDEHKIYVVYRSAVEESSRRRQPIAVRRVGEAVQERRVRRSPDPAKHFVVDFNPRRWGRRAVGKPLYDVHGYKKPGLRIGGIAARAANGGRDCKQRDQQPRRNRSR